MTARPRCRLYLITPPDLGDLAGFASTLEAALDAGDVASVQLRLKDMADEAILEAGRKLGPLIQSRGVAFILNDRPDLARALGADGVHVGQSDTPAKKAREIVGPDAIVGVTCHDSRHLAMEAAEKGADYVAFGAFYPTTTKATDARPEPEILTWWQELMEIPCVAIGGITLDNAGPLIEAGADFLAVSSGVWNHPEGAASAVAGFNALMDRYASA